MFLLQKCSFFLKHFWRKTISCLSVYPPTSVILGLETAYELHIWFKDVLSFKHTALRGVSKVLMTQESG
jgi:hypothetical protein